VLLRGEGSYSKKLDDGEIALVKKLGASDFNIYISGLTPPKRRFSDYLFRQNGFGNYVCKLEGCKPTDFNLWSGFGAKRTGSQPPSLELMKQFFLDTWAAGNQEYYNYIISWFAGRHQYGGIGYDRPARHRERILPVLHETSLASCEFG